MLTVRHSLGMVVVFACQLCLADDPYSIEVKDVGDWAVHEETGRVFASIQSGNEVVEYQPKTGEVRRFKVGETPEEMIIKRDQLIVGCKKSPALFVIDLNTNQVAGSVKLIGKGPHALFCSQVDNNLVYCLCNTGAAFPDGEVFQIDSENLQVRKQLKTQTWGHDVRHVVMATDGKWMSLDARGASSPSGAYLLKVDEDQGTFTQIFGHHDSFGELVAGPANRYWTLGNHLYSLDMTQKIRSFTGSPVAIHPTLDLAVSYVSGKLVLEKFSTGASIADAKFPSAQVSSPSRSHSETFDPTIKYDLRNGYAVVGLETRCCWVDLKDFTNLQPLRMLVAPSGISTLVEEMFRIPINVTNAELEPKAIIEIESGPKGVILEEGHLIWKPSVEDVGFSTIQLAVKDSMSQETIDSVALNVHVTLPEIELGFHAKSMEVSPSGKVLLVWGMAVGQENRHPAHPGPDKLMVIDLSTLKTLAVQEVPQGIRFATIDDKYVFLAPNSGNVFYRLDHTLKASKRQFLKSAPLRLVKISATELVALGEVIETFDIEKMQAKPTDVGAGHSHMPYIDLEGGLLQKPYSIVNTHSGEVLRLHTMSQLPRVETTSGDSGMHNQRNDQSRGWGRMVVNGNSLANFRGGQIASWPQSQTCLISHAWPMAVVVSASNNGRMLELSLQYCNLTEGTVMHSSVFDVRPNNGPSPNFYGERNQMRIVGNKICLINRDKIMIAPIPEAIAEQMPLPICFTEKQTTEVEVGGKKRVLLNVAGQTTGVTFSLMAESPGIDLEADSGNVTLDTDELWASTIAAASGEHPHSMHDGAVPPWQHDENSKWYKAMTGKVLAEDKLAVQLQLSVQVRDSEGQEDALQFIVLLVGPAADVSKAQEDRNKLLVEQQEQVQVLAEAGRETRLKSAQEAKLEATKPQERLDQLEARIRRIEATLDAILQKLEDKPR